MNESQNILVVTLGGTIESFYNPEQGTPNDVPLEDGADKTIIPAALRKLGIAQGCDFYPLAMRDSKYRTEAEMDQLLQHVADRGYERVLIIEGTDATPDQAELLSAKVNAWGPANGMDRKTFVWTGAMQPLRDANKEWREPDADRPNHDGWFVLNMAIHQLQHGLPFGVFVRTKDALWPAGRIEKYRELDGQGPAATVLHSEFRGKVHPDSRGPKITQ